MTARIANTLLGLALVLALACGAAATATPAPVNTPAAQVTSAPGAAATVASPTPVLPTPTRPKTAKNLITLVIPEEPENLNPYKGTSAETANLNRYTMGDPLIWYDGKTLALTPTSGAVRWRQEAPDRWRVFLRPGVKFHNGEPWNAEAAAFSLDLQGKPETTSTSYNYTGGIRAAAVDELTVDILCPAACPIMDRSLAWTAFQAPKWYAAGTPETIASTTVSFGPYKLREYVKGQSIKLVAYEDYVPVPGVAEMQKATIAEQLYLWRKEDLVRAAMVKTGEADWAWNIGVENMGQVPVAKSGGTQESVSWYIDTFWHPMLKQTKFRLAMMHAIDCKEIVKNLYRDVTVCRGIPAGPGVVGATAENIAPYEYNPGLARQLLKEVNYQGEVIRISGREARIPKQTELYEAVAGYLKDVGINAKVEVLERQLWTAMRNCDPKKGYPDKKPDCDFGNIVETAPSYDSLDFGKMAIREMSCDSPLSRICDREKLEPLIASALSASGEDRRRQLEQLANIMKDEAQRMTIMDTFVIYGMSKDLVWEPRPDQHVRGSTMSFAK